MSQLSKVKNFYDVHRKPIAIVLVAVLALLFAGSIVLSVFSGGEFTVEEEVRGVKGLMRLNVSGYAATYFDGDPFVFSKEDSEIMLLAKDPALDNIVRVDDLPGSEYGFRVNGEGEIVYDASDIVITKDVSTVDVVSKAYPDITLPLDVRVYGSLDESKLVNEFTYEAEDAKLYEKGVLLSDEEKQSKPAADKPYVSSYGTSVDGKDCSGGACLRNFQTTDMKVEFEIVSSAAAEIQLEIKCCKRKESKTFGEYFRFGLNGESVTAVDEQILPQGTGYYEPYSLKKVTVKLVRGVNVITFESGSGIGKTNPVNLDAICLTADSAILGGTDAIVD